MKKAAVLRAGLSERMALPPEALAGATKLSVTDGKHVLVENHRGVADCGDELIALNARHGRITLRGSGLVITAMNADEILICGRISSVEWE